MFGTVTTDHCTLTTGDAAKLDISYKMKEENSTPIILQGTVYAV
jgi:hypothetical protein